MSDDMMWREEDDPELLAAAVAAGVEVQLHGENINPRPTNCVTATEFLDNMTVGASYRVPADWQPAPEPPADDLRERIARAIWEDDERAKRDGSDDWDAKQPTDHEVYLANADAVLAVLPAPPVPPWPGDENDDTARLSPDQGDRIVNACCRMLGCEPADIDGDAALEEILTEAVELCADLHGQDRWEDDCHGCGFRVGDHTTDGRCPAPAAPVPPWPGAVLSGLTDEITGLHREGWSKNERAAESSALALALLEALDTTGWATDDVRTLEGIIGRLRRAHRAYVA